MNELFFASEQFLTHADMRFVRYAIEDMTWGKRLTAITGARGVGKSTLMLQYLKANYPGSDKVLYATLDDLYFTNNTLVSLADHFVKHGGTHLFLDEVHKYQGWSREIKNIYDRYPKLKVVFSASSALDIYRGEADLSRRALHYHLPTMSLREYIELFYGIQVPVITMDDILNRSKQTCDKILTLVDFPLKYLHEYYVFGAYPFAVEDDENYHRRLISTINQVIENDLPAVFGIDYHAVVALRKLLTIIAGLVPFKPNIANLSREMGVARDTLLRYISYLAKADIISTLYSDSDGMRQFNKPEKIYLNNPNMIYALSAFTKQEIGTVRETFFMNQVSHLHSLSYSPFGDFLMDSKFTFEVGGQSKKRKQVAHLKNAYIVQDDIEHSIGNIIPIWLFGFLY